MQTIALASVILGIVSLYLTDNKKVHYGFMIVSLLLGVIAEVITLTGAVWILLFMALCWLSFKKCKKSMIKIPLYFLIVGMGGAFALHAIPGFQNLLIWQNVQLSALSRPYTLYLNMDKGLMALGLAVYSGLVMRRSLTAVLCNKHVWIALIGSISLISYLGLMTKYIVFDPTLTSSFWLWALSNLVLVCFAEEILFRGIIQQEMTTFFNRYHVHYSVPLLLSSIIFGLAHYKGGTAYIGLAIIAGVFYGYAYHHSRRLKHPFLYIFA